MQQSQAVPLPERTRIVSKELIHEQILPHMRQDIVANRWQPGERLPEPQLCREFGISRTPLRDALKVLESEGLVKLLPHVGAVVTRLDPPDLAEKFEVLSALEQAAAFKVARICPPVAVREIERLHAAMTEAAGRGDSAVYYALNDAFHLAIVVGADNATLARQHELVMWHIHRARHRANRNEPLNRTAAQHHAAIVEHIGTGQAERAARAMRLHLEDVLRIIMG